MIDRGFCQFSVSTVAAPLANLFRDIIKFEWTSVCQKEFEDVKSPLTASPVLVAPRLDKPFKLQVDSSNVGAGAVLLQISEDDVDCVVEYFKLNTSLILFNLNIWLLEKSPSSNLGTETF